MSALPFMARINRKAPPNVLRRRPLRQGQSPSPRARWRPSGPPLCQYLAGIAFKGPDGAETSLASFAGKTVLLNLWATWCVPCRTEMPALDGLEAALGGEDFTVAAVNIDLGDPARAKDFLDEIGVEHLAFYSDPTSALFLDLKKRGLAFGLPVTLLIDGNGCRIGSVEGPAAWDSKDAQALIKAAIGPG